MAIYTSSKVLPYVYRLDNPITGEFYIGLRCGNKVPSSEDLGKKYFTSSKIVNPRFHEFEMTILAEFFDKKSTYEYEADVIAELWKTEGILNRSNQGKKFISPGNHVFTPEQCKKISDYHKGKKKTEEHRRKISEGHKNKTMVVDDDGKVFKISKDHPDYIAGKYEKYINDSMRDPLIRKRVAEAVSKAKTGKTIVKDIDGNTFQVPVDDPRFLSGEYVHVNKGRTVTEEVRRSISEKSKGVSKSEETKARMREFQRIHILVVDSEGKRFHVNRDDPLYLDGTLISFWKINAQNVENKRKANKLAKQDNS